MNATLGVIGAGTWAIAAHLPAFAARDDVEPLIVCRRDTVLLEEVRLRFGFPRATTDWREVIEAQPDLIVLAGPAALRAEQARAAIDAGCHVLAEKPFTVSAADAWDLDARARAAGRVLMLCYAWNEMGIVEAARRLLVEDGGVGRVEHVSLAMSTVVRDLLTTGRTYVEVPIDSPPRPETWRDPGVSGGGYGQAQLTHGLGILFRLLSDRASEVAATTGPAGSAVELHDAITLRLADGAIGAVSGAALPWGSFGNTHQLQIRVTGERGQVLLDLDRPLVRRTRGEEDDVTVELSEDDVTWSFARVVDRFVDSLAAGRTTESRSPGELGARVVEVLEATYRSAASGRWERTGAREDR